MPTQYSDIQAWKTDLTQMTSEEFLERYRDSLSVTSGMGGSSTYDLFGIGDEEWGVVSQARRIDLIDRMRDIRYGQHNADEYIMFSGKRNEINAFARSILDESGTAETAARKEGIAARPQGRASSIFAGYTGPRRRASGRTPSAAQGTGASSVFSQFSKVLGG